MSVEKRSFSDELRQKYRKGTKVNVRMLHFLNSTGDQNMVTGGEVAMIGAAARLVKKPFEEFYNSCAAGVKALARDWVAAGAVDQMVQTVEDLERIRTVVSRQVSTLSEIYYPAKLINKSKTVVAERVASIAPGKNILITGTAGQGKSVLMRYLAVQELRGGKRIPLFIELRRIDKSADLGKR
jgi:ABC-type glutathione transport system ATPase component